MKTSEFVRDNIQLFRRKFDFVHATSSENEVYLAYKEDNIMNTPEGRELIDNNVAAKRIYSLMFEIPFNSEYFYVDMPKYVALDQFRIVYPDTLLKQLVIRMYKENNE